MYDNLNIKVKPIEEITLEDFNPLEKEGLVNFWLPRYVDVYLMSEISKTLSHKDRPSLVDAGCGSGLCSKLFSDFDIDVLAVDEDGKMIKKAAQTYKQNNLHFLEGDVEELEAITQSRDIEEVDAVYCSFMKKGENWTPFIEKLKPKVILGVLEYYEEGFTSGCASAYKPNGEYSVYGTWPVISYADLANLKEYGSIQLAMMRTVISIEVRKDLLGDLVKKLGTIKEFTEKNIVNETYSWERELIDKIKSKTPSET